MVGAALCGRPMSMKCLCFGRPHRGAPTVFFIFLLLSLPFSAHAEPAVKIVNGREKEVRLSEHQLVLFFKRPATGQMEELVLKVDEGTGFKKGFRLEDFRPNEPVSVEYEEIPGQGPRATQVRKVPLRGVPNEIHRL